MYNSSYYSKLILGMYFQLLKTGYFQILWKREGQWRKLIGWNVYLDLIKHCETYKQIGCSHVDGVLCNLKTCEFSTKKI